MRRPVSTLWRARFWFNENSAAQKSITFVGPNGTGSVGTAGAYFLQKRVVGAKSILLANADKAFCFLSSVLGEVSRSGDSIKIYLDSASNRWALQIRKENSGELHGHVRCMAYDQR